MNKLTVQKLFSLIMEELASGFIVTDTGLEDNDLTISHYRGPEGLEILFKDNDIQLKNYNDSDFKEIKPSKLFQIISKELDNYFKK